MKPTIIDSPFLAQDDRLTAQAQSIAPLVSRFAALFARISLGLAVFFIPFRLRLVIVEIHFPGIYSDYTNLLVFLPDIFILLTLLLWLIDLLARPRRLTLSPLPVSLPVIGLLAASLLSAIFSAVPQIAMYNFLRLLVLGLLFLHLLNEFDDLNFLLLPLAASTAIQSAVSIAQVLKQSSIGLELLGEYLMDPAWSGISIVYAEGVRTLRAYGLSDHPNILGGCLAFSLVLLVSWQVLKHKPNNPLSVAVILSGITGLLLTFSRSAWLAFVSGLAFVGLAVLFTRRYRELGRAANLGLAALLVLLPFLVFFAPLLGVRLNQANAFKEVENEVRALEERLALNAAGNEIFAANALTGVGVGLSPLAMQEMHPIFPYYYQPPHNTLLAAAAETGIFGALFYALLMITPWLLLLFRRKRLSLNPALISISAVLLAVTLVGFFDYYTWLLLPGRIWQFLVWGAWAAVYRNSLSPQNL